MKNVKVIVAFVTLAISFLFISNAGAATINATSCSQSAVQAAVNSAADGDTVVIPDGTCTWTSGITVDQSSSRKSLTIRGLHDCTVDAKGRPTSCQTNITNFFLGYTGVDGKAFRLSNFRMIGGNVGNLISIRGTGKSWRIDHIYFDTVAASSRIIYINEVGATDVTYGVIDSNTIINPSNTFLHYQPDNGGNYGWMRPLDLGGPDALYFENNTYRRDSESASIAVTDSNGPGRFVVRYNDITNGWIQAHDAIVTNHRGVRKWEIYNNTFTYDAKGNWWVVQLRGGTGVMYNNTISDPYGATASWSAQMTIYRAYQTGGDPWDTLCSNSSGKAYLDIATQYPLDCSSGTGCINKDGSSSNPSGYPCRDQTGVDGNNPQVGGGRPFLFWNNKKNGNPMTVNVPAESTNYIVQNRDYCIATTTMPSSCNGVKVNYTPYTYPHPLAQAATLPPRNLRNVK